MKKQTARDRHDRRLVKKIERGIEENTEKWIESELQRRKDPRVAMK